LRQKFERRRDQPVFVVQDGAGFTGFSAVHAGRAGNHRGEDLRQKAAGEEEGGKARQKCRRESILQIQVYTCKSLSNRCQNLKARQKCRRESILQIQVYTSKSSSNRCRNLKSREKRRRDSI
jgi:hypothetical protein